MGRGEQFAVASIGEARVSSVRRSFTTPSASTPYSEKVFFAKSISSLETALTGLPLLLRIDVATQSDTSMSDRHGEVPPEGELGLVLHS